MAGKLIVFEGGEGSGKTTQIQKLRDWLLAQDVFDTLQKQGKVSGLQLTREPGGTALGKDIRQLLLTPRNREQDSQICNNTELLLYAADRAQHVEETIVPWLEAGYWVLCDRFTDSTVAYQGYGRQLDLGLIHQLNQIATGGLKSDLTLWLNVSPDVGLDRMQQRGEADRMEQAGKAFHTRVCGGFEALATPLSKTGDETSEDDINPYSSGPMVEIDGNQPLEAVSVQIQDVIKQRVKQWYPHLSLN
ncbi:MAG: dTMP kinase [Phormidesmis sp.]